MSQSFDNLVKNEQRPEVAPSFSAADFRQEIAEYRRGFRKFEPNRRAISEIYARLSRSQDVRDFQFLLWLKASPKDAKYHARFSFERLVGGESKMLIRSTGNDDLDGTVGIDMATGEIAKSALDVYLENNEDKLSQVALAYFDHILNVKNTEVDLVGDEQLLVHHDLYSPRHTEAHLDDSYFYMIAMRMEAEFESIVPADDAEQRAIIEQASRVMCGRDVYTRQDYYRLIARLDAQFAQKLLMQQLQQLEPNEKARRVVILEALAFIGTETQSIVDGKVTMFGETTELENVSPKAVTIERVSIYGQYGAMTAEGGVAGMFNILEAEKTASGLRALVKELQMEDLFFADLEGDIEVSAKEEVLEMFQVEYQRWKDHSLLTEAGLHIDQLTIREQAILFYALRTDKFMAEVAPFLVRKQVLPLRAALLDLGYTGSTQHFKTLWQNSRYSRIAGIRDRELYRVEEVSPHLSDPIHWVVNYYAEAALIARVLHEHLQEERGLSNLSVDDITRGLVNGAMVALTDALESVGDRDSWEEKMQSITDNTKLALSFIRDIAQSSESKHVVQLNQYERRQAALVALMENRNTKQFVIEMLVDAGVIKPIPEIHWRVDRAPEEYKRRLGVDVAKLVSGPDAYVIELGPGSGAAKAERQQQVQAHEFAVADHLYYSAEQFVHNLINFGALEQASGALLDDKERRVIAEIIYKLVYLEAGTESSNKLTYAAARIKKLTDSPSSITTLMVGQFSRLAEVSAVPSTISRRLPSGEVVYPYKISITDQSPAVQRALVELQRQGEQFVKVVDPLAQLPMHPEGIIVGDLSIVGKIEQASVDVILGVRSSVYKRGEDWIKLGTDVARALKPGGVWVDDSIRDNDGYRYRLDELQQLKNALAGQDVSVGVIFGPGFPGEDFVEGQDVPLSLVMTKGVPPESKVGAIVEPGFSLRTDL